jgi:hypothetical protein
MLATCTFLLFFTLACSQIIPEDKKSKKSDDFQGHDADNLEELKGKDSTPNDSLPTRVDTSILETLGDLGQIRSLEDLEKPNTPKTITIYRYVNRTTGDHDFVPKQGILEPLGYEFENITFSAFSSQFDGTHEIFRCLIPSTNNHFISRSNICEGSQYTLLESYGYLLSSPIDNNNLELKRCQNGKDHLATVTPQECLDAGYTVEDTLGYLPTGGM